MTTSHEYDHALKKLFSHPEMIESLIRTFVPHDWVAHLEFSTLEPMKGEYISHQLRERRLDSVWKIRANQEWLYLIFLLEFQSSNDYYMSARILTYGGLAYLDIIKNKKNVLPKSKLPPVLPIVFYTGANPWKGPTEFQNCLSNQIPPALMEYQFNSKYLVLDIGHLPLEKFNISEDNLVLSLINIERAKSIAEVNKAILNARERLKGKGDSLKRAFLLYSLRALKVQEKFPGVQISQLTEVSMLYEQADQIWANFAHENRQEGRQEGRQELAYELLFKAINKHYPQQPADTIKARLQKASSSQLSQWLDKVLENNLELHEIID